MTVNSINFINKVDTSSDNYYLNPYKYIFNDNIEKFEVYPDSEIDSIIKTLSSIIIGNKNNVQNNNYLKNDTTNLKKKNIDTTLFKLIANNKIKDIINLINTNKKLNINIQDEDGDTPLHIAVFMCNYDACRILLENNANIFIKDKWGQTCLHRICFCMDNINVLKIVNYFLTYSNNFVTNLNIFNSTDSAGNTPFHLVLKYIIKNNLGVTKNHIKLIEKLKIFTDCQIKNKVFHTAIDLLKLINLKL